MGSYKSVRSVKRAFDVLCALNRYNGTSVQQISDEAGVHRTTVYRVLETLMDLGFVQKSPSDDSYRLTIKVRMLSEGFDDDAWISTVAAPVLGELFRKVLWPTDLCTFERDSMIIRETTHRFSPFSVHHAMVGRRLPMLTSATGRAYLAHCSGAERQQILRVLAASDAPQNAMARTPAMVLNLLKAVRKTGYAVSAGEAEKNFTALALPILWRGRVLACINVVFFSTAMSVKEAAERYLPALREAVAAIEAGVAVKEGAGVAEPLSTPAAILEAVAASAASVEGAPLPGGVRLDRREPVCAPGEQRPGGD